MEPIIFVGVWILCGFASAFLAQSKGDDARQWFIIGVLLGPLGVLLALLAPGKRR